MPARMCLLLGSTALLLGGAAATPALSSEHQFTEHLNRAQLEYRVVPHRRVAWVRRWVWDDFWGDYHVIWLPRLTATGTVSYTPHSHHTHTATVSDGSGDAASSKSKDPSGSNSDKADKSDKDSKDATTDKNAPDSRTASSEPSTAKSDKDTVASVEPAARPQPPANADKNDKDSKLAALDAQPKPTQTADKPAATVKPDLTKPVTPAEIRTAVALGKVADPKQTLASTPIKSVWGDAIGKVRGVDMNGGNLKTVDAVLGGKTVVKIDPARLKYVKSRGLLITTLSKQDAEKLPKADNS